MQRSDQTATAKALWKAIEEGDWDAAAACLHEEYVQEWPQSGERIVGRDNALAINRNFPGGVPRMTLRRAVGQGDLVATEVELRYADGSFYHGVSILEFRGGKVVRETDYFAQPFQAPQWRAQWVRRM
jgi:ketosteroid isomerase-like protein